MAGFLGGSAYAMATQIGEGYTLLNPVMLRKFSKPELQQLVFEMEKLQRETRAVNPPVEDQAALQAKNRRLGRLRQGLMVLNHQISQRR